MFFLHNILGPLDLHFYLIVSPWLCGFRFYCLYIVILPVMLHDNLVKTYITRSGLLIKYLVRICSPSSGRFFIYVESDISILTHLVAPTISPLKHPAWRIYSGFQGGCNPILLTQMYTLISREQALGKS